VVDHAEVHPGELVLDVGAGHGALTGRLVDAGARVVAVELHHGRAARLRERFAAEPVTVVRADAASLRLPRQPFRVVASPPYGISTALLSRLLAPGSRLVAADLVLQLQLVKRYCEGRAPGAGRWQRTWSLERGLSLPRRAFRPPPQVDSVVLVIRRRG
jgi:23S rRNA (adenine-N6)-dimethyltransferase